MPSDVSVVHVDDDPGIVELTGTYLERHSDRFDVTSATSAGEAMECITAETDCVVSDYEMVDMNGVELLGVVREEYPDLPFILFTGKGSEEIASEAISAGVTDYLQKETNVEQYTLLANRVLNAVGQRRAEQSLETERQRFQSLFDELTQPAVEIEYEADEPIVRAVNAAFESVFGYTAANIVGESLDAVIVPEDGQETAAEINRAVQNNESLATREVTRTTQQGPRKFLIQTAAYGDGSGGFAIYTDITAQQRREQKLSALHDVAEELAVAGSIEAACERTVTASKDILSFDISVVSLEEGDQLVPTAVSEEVPPDGLAAMSVSEGIVGKTYRTGDAYVFDDLTTVPEANPQGPYKSAISVPIGDHGTFQAVAKTEASFNELDRELAELLSRHAENALDRLCRQQQLERQTERLNQFAGMLSHDLRNPLNVAVGETELLRDECDSDRIATTSQAHRRIQELVESVLTLVRSVEEGTTVEPVALATVAERGWHSVETGDATLSIVTDQEINADPSQLQQLFENLFRNAVEHADEAVTVTVDADAEGFYVADTGPGIPAAAQDEVFSPGYSTTADGTGLGLAIVYEIAQAHGWDVAVTDSESGGTRIAVTDVDVTADALTSA